MKNPRLFGENLVDYSVVEYFALNCRGFIVHAFAEMRKDRLCILGRLADGRSFASIETRWRPSILIYQSEEERCRKILSSVKHNVFPARTESFEGTEKLLELKFDSFPARTAAAKLIANAKIKSPDCNQKIPEAYLVKAGIRGTVEINGNARAGALVDLVFRDPVISASSDDPLAFPVRVCSVDIETDVKTGAILAIGFSVSAWNRMESKRSLVRVVRPCSSEIDNVPEGVIFHDDEKSMLAAFLDDMAKAGADVLTGWNFLDFDFPRLAERCSFYRIPFLLGRSREEAVFFPGLSASAAAYVPGRQVVDALRIVRSGPRKFSGYTLETVARAVLGESKTVTSSGDEKIRDLEKLYAESPAAFGEYCRRDAELVLEILEKTGLFRLTLERSSLTGVSLDKAWTSVVSFERIYGTELASRNIAPPAVSPESVSGAAGGTVLEPGPGVFHNVGVFDFRSLYPTIMRTFNIDPLAYARSHECTARARENAANSAGTGNPEMSDNIRAPNGACFSRAPGILPEIITSYFEERRKALKRGDEEASFVYKILMNSFYGVLGSASCVYGKTELAGAITSFARKWLHFSRDWFNDKGFRVLYGDTDSLFVESCLDESAPYSVFGEWGKNLTTELNLRLGAAIKKEYGLDSCLELRFEKPYRRLLIPPLRNLKGESRGRAKGYGGWRLDSSGGLVTEVVGMEAVRSDSTALARRIQVQLLELVFNGRGQNELKSYINGIIRELRRGNLDGELVYRKKLMRAPVNYTSSTPPQVKAARALGWKNRRGTVEYVWTMTGPQPIALPYGPLDYDHYADSQILPVARSIAAAAGWDTEIFPHSKKDHLTDGQIELEF